MTINSTTGVNASTSNSWFEENKDQVSVESFLELMVAQLQNQDFTNPVDDTQYVAQLAQFATMQAMQELNYFSKSNYVMSMVGKEVTASRITIGGNMETVTGVVTKISLVDNEFGVFIGDEMFSLSQIMEIKQVTSND
ncbi:MAG TPA: flagellar hook capping FlgD N-terminal domain-containing protein [Erysipelotrichaceae bacterium]|nr:flagellar hook capping FlgD N-terminal domain-containing protein [Erysipelotrichaceae bacterium]